MPGFCAIGAFILVLGRPRAVLAKGNDPCKNNGPCGNHGSCYGTGQCSCSCGWTGPTCTTAPTCSSLSCGHGTCDGSSTEGYSCSCSTGYSGCECQHNVCEGKNCNDHGHCVIGSSYSCACNGQWSGHDCENDPCHQKDCGHGKCRVTGDAHVCDCDEGYKGTSCGSKVSCGDVSSQLLDQAKQHSSGCSGELLYDEECTTTCEEGYTAADKRATIKCKAKKGDQKGHFDGSLDCKRE
jgi:hypothetical protein